MASGENFDEIVSQTGLVEGELVWYSRSRQRYSEDEWENEDVGLVRVKKGENGDFLLVDPFQFPSFSADQDELIEELRRLSKESGNAQLEHYGRSGFASRNTIVVTPIERATPYDVKTLTRLIPTEGESKYEVGENKQVLNYSSEDVENISILYQNAKENVANNRRKRFLEKFAASSKDGIFGMVSEGGYEEKVIVPSGKFVELYSVRTANTQDGRQNRTHTYEVGYIDVEAAKKSVQENGELPITIPKKVIRYLDSYSIERAIRYLGTNGLDISDMSLKLGGVDPSVELEDGELVWLAGETKTLARVSKGEDGKIELESFLRFPSFSADQEELISELKKREDIELSYSGRSGFASRNTATVKTKEKSENYDLKTLIRYYSKNGTRYAIDNNTQDVYYSLEDAEKAYEAYTQAKESIRAQRLERFMSKFRERSLDGVFSIVAEGGYEEKVEIPEGRFLECFRMRTANTQDHRQNRTHTDDVGYIDIEKAKSLARNGKLHINLPEEYMGKMIGAKGSNIKRLQEVLGQIIGDESALRIILHTKTKEEVEIKLAQIQKAIDEQKAQTHE